MRDDFAALARGPEDAIDVVRAALLIAREEYPALDVDAERARVDALARDVSPRRPEALNAFFFKRFRGNTKDYYDPRNSYLNDVLDRRTGIPITLSVIYVDIARRLGLPASGVGFPGRYLVRCADALVDCFDGRVIDRERCQELLDEFGGDRMRLSDGMLRDSAPRETIARMLTNLRGVFLRRGEPARALRFAELAASLHPDAAGPLRDRGVILLHLEQFGRAVGDLEEYARRAPDAPDKDAVREQLSLARALLARVN